MSSAQILEMGINKKDIKFVTILTSLEELERIVSEFKKGFKKWEESPDDYSNIAITCSMASEDSGITFRINKPSNI